MIRTAPAATAETATALIHRYPNGVLELRFKPAARETAETAWANVRTVHNLLPEPFAEREPARGRPAASRAARLYPHPLLLDLRGIANVDPLARVCYLSAAASAAGSALAMVTGSPVSTLFGIFFMTNNRRHRPAQIFPTRHQAACWLEQFIALDDIVMPAPLPFERRLGQA